MGYYDGQRKNPCPRCGGVVLTVFVSVGAMSFHERCVGCGTEDFTPDEAGRNVRFGVREQPDATLQPSDIADQHSSCAATAERIVVNTNLDPHRPVL